MHWRRLEAMYHGAPVNRYFAPRVTIGDGTADLAMEVREDMFHAANAAHGVVYFKALDDAAFFAANSRVPDVFVLTARLEVDLLRPLGVGLLAAKGRLAPGDGKRLVAESEAWDAEGRLVGKARGEFARSRITLADLPGYR